MINSSRVQLDESARRPFGAQFLKLGTTGLLVTSLVAPLSCSFLYDLSPTQCENTADCRARGQAFSAATCQAGLCVIESDGTGGAGGAQAECTTNGECIEKNFGSPYLCRDGSCIPLTAPPTCPVILGAGQDYKNLRDADPIVIGAYSHVDPLAPRLSTPTLNYDLAIEEFNEASRGGLPGGQGGRLRPIVAVVCSGTNNPDLTTSSAHLYENLRVPAVISSLFTKDLLATYLGQQEENGAFFMSPLEADSTLTGVEDDDRMWHMLASGTDLAVAFPPLLERVERYVRERESLAEEPLKVAMVEARTPFLNDMADALFTSLRWNGASAVQNERDGYLLRIATDSAIEVSSPNVQEALTSLRAFEPDIVVAVSSSEFATLLTSYEAQLSESARKPFYLLSPYLFGVDQIRGAVSDSVAADRTLGVNFAAAADPNLYDLYLSRLKSKNPNVDFNLEGSENFYDATYYVLYAIAASAPHGPLSGERIAAGMRRVVSGSTAYDIGPSKVGAVLTLLRRDPEIAIKIVGTMGPPDFDVETGERHGLPSVYCLNANGFVQNAMSYNPETQDLEGNPTCIPDFSP